MTIAPTSAIIADFAGGSSSEVDMMIGIGLVKDSDAVFFQYLGEERTPQALMMPSGKPVYNLQTVQLVGLEVVSDIGEYNATKLNVVLESGSGTRVMLTSGITTLWSQALITCMMGLYNGYSLDQRFTLNTWKGEKGKRPCFASVKVAGQRVTHNETYNAFSDAKMDRDMQKIEAIARDAADLINTAITGGPVLETQVTDLNDVEEDLGF